MKKVMTVVLALAVAGTAIAQKSGDYKVMLQQIAKLQVQIYQVKQGYDIVRNGLNTIGNWTNGEYKLHQNHFNSLVNVNPNIKNSEKVQEARKIYREILREFNSAIVRAQGSGLFDPKEITYYNQVNERLIKDCRHLIESLTAMVSDGQLKMTDDERMANIDKYHAEMLSNYTFARNFCGDIRSTQLARKKYKDDAEQVRMLFGIEKQ